MWDPFGIRLGFANPAHFHPNWAGWAITVEDGQNFFFKLGEHKVIRPEKHFLGLILCFLCI